MRYFAILCCSICIIYMSSCSKCKPPGTYLIESEISDYYGGSYNSLVGESCIMNSDYETYGCFLHSERFLVSQDTSLYGPPQNIDWSEKTLILAPYSHYYGHEMVDIRVYASHAEKRVHVCFIEKGSGATGSSSTNYYLETEKVSSDYKLTTEVRSIIEF